MSVARTEAERIYRPAAPHDAPYERKARVNAYVRGRTAEPCEDQVKAVAKILFEEPWRSGDPVMTFEELVELVGGYTDEHVDRFMRPARMILEAARKAVM